MNVYLDTTDKDAFVDFPGKLRPSSAYPSRSSECPKCKGYGGWNLKLNAYPLHNLEDNAENRHKFSHFRQGCYHCSGWGWVREEDANHVHDWDFVSNLGNCLNLYECNICGKTWQVDSSD